MDLKKIETIIEEPIKEIKSDNYFILVYNYNLLENK